MQLRYWVQRGPWDWRALDRVLDTPTFKNTYLWVFIIPLAAKFSSKFPDEVQLELENGLVFKFTLQLPFTWYCIYAAALCFFVARALYDLSCPQFIKLYKDAGDGISKGLTVQKIQSQTSRALRAHLKELGSDITMDQTDLSRLYYQWVAVYPNAKDDKISESLPPEELKNAFEQKSWRLRGKEEKRFSCVEVIERATVQVATDSKGYYKIESVRGRGIIPVERNHFIMTLFWDLERYLRNTRPFTRAICMALVILGAFSLAFVFYEGLSYVVTRFLAGH